MRLLLILSLLFLPSLACAETLMLDEDMEAVTARGVGLEVTKPEPGSVAFQFDGKKQGLIGLSVFGNAKIQAAEITPSASSANITNNSSVILQDDAQSNLNALVNVNAANAWVQVLMNLTVINNSTVNNVSQGNLSQPILIP